MTTLALRGKSRQLLSKLHRWSGLAVLFLLFITAVTGTVLAFRYEVDAWLNPQLFHVQPETSRMPLGDIINRVETRYPGLRVSSLGLPQTPSDSLRLFVRREQDLLEPPKRLPGMRSEAPFNQVFADPYRGIVLGTRDSSAFRLDRANFVPFMLRLHYSLFLAQWGVWLLGGCAIVWFLSSWIGLALSWPRAARRLAAWRPLLTVRCRQGSYKFNYDLHRAAGLISLPVLIVVAFTSIYLNLPELVKPAIAAISPLGNGSAPRLGRIAIDAPVVAAETAIRQAENQLPGSRATFVQRDLPRGIYSVRLKRPGDVGNNGDHSVWIAMHDGRIVGTRLAEARSGGDTFVAWMRPLHGGSAFGLVGQTLVCLAALALAALCATGMVVWLRKRRGERKLAVKRQAHSINNAVVQP